MKGVLVGEREHHGIGLEGTEEGQRGHTPVGVSELGPAPPLRGQGSSWDTATGLSLVKKIKPNKML